MKRRGTDPPEVDWNASHGSDFAKASVSLVSGRGLSATSHVGGASSPWVKGVIRAQQLLPGWGIRKHTSLGREQQRRSKGTVGPPPKEGGGFSAALRGHDRAAPPCVVRAGLHGRRGPLRRNFGGG